MNPEKLNLQFDIRELKDFVETLVKIHPPVMRSKAVGGWSLQGFSDSYQDGWNFGFCPYNGPFNQSPCWTPKNSVEKNVKSIQDFSNPTSINSAATLKILDRLQELGFHPRRARIMKLSANSSCVWHQDGNRNVYQVRLHIPIITNEQCFFDYEDASHQLQADGSAYLLRINRPHRVRNESPTDRYHFVSHIWDTRKISQYHTYDPQECDHETDHLSESELAKLYNLEIGNPGRA